MVKGGHTKTASYRSFGENVKQVGAEDAVKIARLEYNCMVAVHDFIRENGIDCDARRCDTVDVFYDSEQWEAAHESVDLMRSLMGSKDPAPEQTFFNSEETAKAFLVPDSLGSLKYEAGSLSAYKLTIGILKLALKKGLNLQCNTPATGISRVENGHQLVRWLVTTPRGTITAKQLVLATNGYTARLYSRLQGVVVPFRGFVTAQRPGQAMPQTGLETTYSFVYGRGYEYMISRPRGTKFQGDIVIGGGLTKGTNEGADEYGNTDDTVAADDRIVQYLLQSTQAYFGASWGPDHPDGRLRKSWSGIMGYSGDGYPLVGPVPGEDGLFLDVSFQGHGMVLCFLCANAVTQMIRGRDDEKLSEWFPNAYRVTEERLQKKFQGRLKVSGAAEAVQNGEIKENMTLRNRDV